MKLFRNATFRSALKLIVVFAAGPLLLMCNAEVSFSANWTDFGACDDFDSWSEILATLQKTGFVAAGLVVAGFQLRTRIIDVLQKDYFSSHELERLEPLATSCTKRLSSIMFRLVLTAAYLSLCTLMCKAFGLGLSISAGAVILLIWGILDFLAILVSFDELEEFTMESIKRHRRREELKELAKATTDTDEEVQRRPRGGRRSAGG